MSLTSRFFAARSSDSESEDEIIKKPTEVRETKRILSESSDDERVKRYVRSGAEKKKEEYWNVVKKLKNSIKIKDFDQILTEFTQLHRIITKYKDTYLPQFAIKVLYQIDEQTRVIWEDKEQKAKFNKIKLKAFTGLRQKIKKMNKEYEELIENCRKNPAEYPSEPEFEEPSSSESEFVQTEVKVSTSKYMDANTFIKSDKVKEVAQKRERKVKVVKKKEEEGIEQVPRTIAKSTKELFKLEELEHEQNVIKIIRDVARLRGKKLSDRVILNSLYEIKRIVEIKKYNTVYVVKLLLLIVSIQSDTFSNDRQVKPEAFKSLLTNYQALLKILTKNNEYIIKDDIHEEDEKFDQPPYTLMGNCTHVIFRINEELNKILQNTDYYSLDYIEKMKEVGTFSSIVLLLQEYVEKHGSPRSICEVYLLRIEQLYYRLDIQWLLLLKRQLSENNVIEDPHTIDLTISDESVINSMCKYIIKHGRDRTPVRATLCQVYHHAIHDRWHKAKQLFLMSRIQETILNSDIPTQILFNRVTVQLGLCAFRQGYFKECANALKEIQQTGHIKELLAQGINTRNTEKTPKQEMMEKRQLLPFHMHINLELVECVYLVSILLTEAVFSVAPHISSRELMSSRGFIQLIKNYEKLAIHGPPETMRECIFAAYKSLKVGNYLSTYNHIKNIKCWKLLTHSKETLEHISSQLQQQCLTSFLFSNCYCYKSITLSDLKEKYQLDDRVIKSTVNSIIIDGHLPAKWNQESTVLTIFSNKLPKDVDYLCQDLVNVLSEYAEQNKRLKDTINNVKNAKEIQVSHKNNYISR